MKKAALIVILSAFFTIGYSQSRQDRVHIQGGSKAWENLTREMYMYPSFQEGVVEFKTGQSFNASMNYNRMLETVQFIKGNDTLTIANEEYIRQLKIGNDVYIFQPQCMKAINSHPNITFYKHEALRIADLRRKGAFGIPNSTSAIASYNQVYTWLGSYELNPNELLLLSKSTDFYFSANSGELVRFSKKNVLKAFAKDGTIKDFIESKNTNFSVEKDLVDLTEFISKAGQPNR